MLSIKEPGVIVAGPDLMYMKLNLKYSIFEKISLVK